MAARSQEDLSTHAFFALHYALAILEPRGRAPSGRTHDEMFRLGLQTFAPNSPEFPTKPKVKYCDLPERELTARIQHGLKELSDCGAVVLRRGAEGGWEPKEVRWEAWLESTQRLITQDCR